MSDNQYFIITGEKGEGKTGLLIEVLDILKNKEINISGFYAKGYWKNNKRSAFDLVNIKTAKSIPLCRAKETENRKCFFGYYFNPEALKAGDMILANDNISDSDIIVIDEIGKLDIEGHIWHDAVSKLIYQEKHNMLLCVRKAFVKDVVKYWKIENPIIFEVGKDNAKSISEKIINFIK